MCASWCFCDPKLAPARGQCRHRSCSALYARCGASWRASHRTGRHNRCKQLTVSELVPCWPLQVEHSPNALSYQIRAKLAFAQLLETAVQRAITFKAQPGKRDSERINALASAQFTEAHRLTEHALKGADDHASLICLTHYIAASLLMKIKLATVCNNVQRIMEKYRDPDLWLDPQQEGFEKVSTRLKHVPG